MDIKRIKSVLNESSSTIQSAESFSDRLNVVYDILNRAFPQASAVAAMYGSITGMMDYMSRIEIDPLLQVIKKSANSGHEYVTTDNELSEILQTIYSMIKE